MSLEHIVPLALFGSSSNDPPLPCLMNLWVLHHFISMPASSDSSRSLETQTGYLEG
jgi:hypothetical protein